MKPLVQILSTIRHVLNPCMVSFSTDAGKANKGLNHIIKLHQLTTMDVPPATPQQQQQQPYSLTA